MTISIHSTRMTARASRFARFVSTGGGHFAGLALVLVAACSSSSATPSETTDGGAQAQTTCGPVMTVPQPAAATCVTPGGASTGGTGPDVHCLDNGTRTVQATGACQTTSDAGAGGGDSSGDDGGFVDDGTCGMGGYQPTIYGTSGADDDCKYDVSWTSTSICQNGPVYFTVTAKKRSATSDADDTPLTGAVVRIESYFYDCKTPPKNSPQMSTETSPGVYKVGPVLFNTTGRWNVRFHFDDCCVDLPKDSPHGHAAFWVDVP